MSKATKTKLRWASLIYPATHKDVIGNCIVVWDTEDHTYTIRFITPDLSSSTMLYTGVVKEDFDGDGNSITKAKFGVVCDRLGLRLKPRLDISTFDVKEYHTLHYGDYVTATAKNKITLAITGRSLVYCDDMGSPLEITVKGRAGVSLNAARASLWSEAKKKLPGIHWKRDLAVISIADDINIDIDDA